MRNTDVVTVRGLRKAYGNRVVVDDLDLDVPAGEIVGLIGANGAGKTTTVECIQGLRRPDAGDAAGPRLRPRYPGRASCARTSAASCRTRRCRTGCGWPRRSSCSAPRGPGRRRAARPVRAGARRRSAFASLSGGERQRLFLVLALLNRPRLVILDELTQGLDPAARRDVWAAIRQLHEDGTTVLLVTHEMDEAEACATRSWSCAPAAWSTRGRRPTW